MVSLAALALVGVGPAALRAQDPLDPSIPREWLRIAGVTQDPRAGLPDPGTGTGGPMPTVNATVPLTSHKSDTPEHGLSQWMVGTDPSCCGHVGDHNPLQSELYIRSGIAFTGGDGAMADSLQDGWLIQGGGRVLFYNDSGNAALTFDLHLLNIHNHGVAFPPRLHFFEVPVNQNIFGQQTRVVLPEIDASVNAYNRTFLGFGPGLEWYLMGAANGTRQGGCQTLRVGVDGGGRWGTAKAEFRDLRHFTDVIGAVYGAVHSDYECPIGCCTLFAGLRAEYDYTWSDILQIQNKADVMDLNLSLTFGVRY